MAFWHDVITEKGFLVLQELSKQLSFVLIGGWAVYLYTHSLKSKDIDIVLDYTELEKLKGSTSWMKNDRLKKYEARKEDIQIDIYVPFYSNPGIPAEFLMEDSLQREGFRVPQPELLLLLKQHAFAERRGSLKGEKDRLDIVSLINMGELDWTRYQEMLQKFHLEKRAQELVALLHGISHVPELNISSHRMAKLRQLIPFNE